MRQLNPLVNVVYFGQRINGTSGTSPSTPAGTDFKHYRRIIYSLPQPFIFFGKRMHGTAGATIVVPPVVVPPAVGGPALPVRGGGWRKKREETEDETRLRMLAEIILALRQKELSEQETPVAEIEQKAEAAKADDEHPEWDALQSDIRRIGQLEKASARAKAELAALETALTLHTILQAQLAEQLAMQDDEDALIALLMH